MFAPASLYSSLSTYTTPSSTSSSSHSVQTATLQSDKSYQSSTAQENHVHSLITSIACDYGAKVGGALKGGVVAAKIGGRSLNLSRDKAASAATAAAAGVRGKPVGKKRKNGKGKDRNKTVIITKQSTAISLPLPPNLLPDLSSNHTFYITDLLTTALSTRQNQSQNYNELQLVKQQQEKQIARETEIEHMSKFHMKKARERDAKDKDIKNVTGNPVRDREIASNSVVIARNFDFDVLRREVVKGCLCDLMDSKSSAVALIVPNNKKKKKTCTNSYVAYPSTAVSLIGARVRILKSVAFPTPLSPSKALSSSYLSSTFVILDESHPKYYIIANIDGNWVGRVDRGRGGAMCVIYDGVCDGRGENYEIVVNF